MKNGMFAILIILALALPATALAGYVSPSFLPDNGKWNAFNDFQLEITTGGDGQVVFTFSNESSLSKSSIYGIFFDDGLLFKSVEDIEGSADVVFTEDKKPKNYPGGPSLDPKFETDFSFSSGTPNETWGINPDEWLSITFNLLDDIDYEAVKKAYDDGELRIGLQAKSENIGGQTGQSEITPMFIIIKTPEPSLILLLGFGLGAAFVASARLRSGKR